MTSVVDTNVLIRHLTHDDPALGSRATEYLRAAGPREIILTDVVAAESAIVLQRYYGHSRSAIAQALRSAIAAPQIRCDGAVRLQRASDLYEMGADFVDAYAVATAEEENATLLSFDRRSTRNTTVKRIEP